MKTAKLALVMVATILVAAGCSGGLLPQVEEPISAQAENRYLTEGFEGNLQILETMSGELKFRQLCPPEGEWYGPFPELKISTSDLVTDLGQKFQNGYFYHSGVKESLNSWGNVISSTPMSAGTLDQWKVGEAQKPIDVLVCTDGVRVR